VVLAFAPIVVAAAILLNLPAPHINVAPVPVDVFTILRWGSLPLSLFFFFKPDRQA
jgi:hypothetical protein